MVVTQVPADGLGAGVQAPAGEVFVAVRVFGARSSAPAVRQRRVVTPICWHMDNSGQAEQRGRSPVHMRLPNGTSRSLISIQYSRGSTRSSAAMVRSGVLART